MILLVILLLIRNILNIFTAEIIQKSINNNTIINTYFINQSSVANFKMSWFIKRNNYT